MANNSTKGTTIKLNIWMEPMDGFHLADVDWDAEVYSEWDSGKVIIPKEKARKVDEDNYVIAVDSSFVGEGRYLLTLSANIPDTDCPGGVRVEKATVKTDVIITDGMH